MVAVEAAAHGLPTVAYATGGVVDAVAEGVSGYLVSNGDSALFARRIEALLDEPLSEQTLYTHAQRFAWSEFGRRMRTELTHL